MGDLITGGPELFEEVLNTMKTIDEEGVKSYTPSFIIYEGDIEAEEGSLKNYYEFLFFKNVFYYSFAEVGNSPEEMKHCKVVCEYDSQDYEGFRYDVRKKVLKFGGRVDE